LLVLGACAACGSDSNDVVGPFTGQTHTFYLDRLEVPRDNAQALAVAGDLDGDEAVENQFGNVTGVLASTNDLSLNSADMIASRYLSSYIEIQADDLTNDDSVGVTFFVQGGDQDHVPFGGTLVGGAFVSNRTS
jgi:hypothetical protein